MAKLRFNEDISTPRDLYVHEALRYIPRLLELIDRNPFHKTYGCFDRSYWHYRTADFPSGMYQEFVLPLALVYRYEFPASQYYRKDRIKELVLAAIKYAARSSRKDGSCDDYYPHENALGAAAFSLYASTEAYQLMGFNEEDCEAFFSKRASWILNHHEEGRLSNHQALAAVALYNVYLITREVKFLEGAREKIDLVLSWQSREGWFVEYDGCDPGYLTYTIDFLAKYYSKTHEKRVLEALKRAVEFVAYFIHPDGSYGGEYGSRNTYHFLPHGFELIGHAFPLATQIADRFIDGVVNKKNAVLEDDRIFCHTVYNYLQAYLDYSETRKGSLEKRNDFSMYFPEAQLFVRKQDPYYVVISIAKGGVFKFFKDKELIVSDCGYIAETDRRQIVVSHLAEERVGDISESRVVIIKSFHDARHNLPTPLKFVIFRILNLTLGRWAHRWMRRLLQSILILHRDKVPVRLERTIDFSKGVTVRDKITIEDPALSFKRMAIGTDHTSIYVATSNPYQEVALKEWVNIKDDTARLNRDREIEIVRELK